MTQHDIRTELERSAAAAARTTPGVAFLRPSLTGLLRTVAQGGVGWGRAADASGATPDAFTDIRPEVRAVRNATDGTWNIELRLAVRRGYRALDVTRSVRLAVEDATRPVMKGGDGLGGGDGGRAGTVLATVIVTGVV